MKDLSKLVREYVGKGPIDKDCKTWAEMKSKMEKDINQFFDKEIELFSNRDFLESALIHYFDYAYRKLQRKDLGDIERVNYEKQLQKSKQILESMGRF
jgi:hypothetical protein